MTYADIINGCFEAAGGIAQVGNCVALYKDKKIRGVSIYATLLFTSWGYWNLYLYPSVNL
jgi:hypothetical protein